MKYGTPNSKKVLIGFAVLLSVEHAIAVDSFSVQAQKPMAPEQFERLVDRAALDVQLQAISRIQNKLNLLRPDSLQKPVLQLALGQAYVDAASFSFRIAHEKSHRNKRAPDLKEYDKYLNLGVTTLTTFLEQNPQDERLSEALFARAQAYADLKKMALAEKDYHRLVRDFASAPEAPSSNIRLAEIFSDRNDHLGALKFLSVVEGKKNDPHYAQALYKAAWSQYNLGQTKEALDYLRRFIDFYNAKTEQKDPLNSDLAMKENGIRDVALFYFDGYQKTPEDFSLEASFERFQNIVGKQNNIDSVVVRFTGLLRSRNQDAELRVWSQLVYQASIASLSKIDSFRVLMENAFNRKNLKEMDALLSLSLLLLKQDKNLLSSEAVLKTRKLASEGIEYLNVSIEKNKNIPGVKDLLSPLSRFYAAFIEMSVAEDPVVAQAHYNLAETLFKLKKFDEATIHYRAIVSELPRQATIGMNLEDIQLRALGSRYQELIEEKRIVKDIQVSSYSQETPGAPEVKLSEWLEWIDELKYKPKADLAKYEFEGIRALYGAKKIQLALSRIEQAISYDVLKKNRDASLNLYLDTLILSQDWQRLYQYGKRLEGFGWVRQDESLYPKVRGAIVSSLTKQIEKHLEKNEENDALVKAESCVKEYGKNKEASFCLLYMAQFEKDKGQLSQAENRYSFVIDVGADPKAKEMALVERSKSLADKLLFEESLKDELALFQLYPQRQLNEKEQTRLLRLAYLTEDKKALAIFQEQFLLCQKAENASLCFKTQKQEQDVLAMMDHWSGYSAFDKIQSTKKLGPLVEQKLSEGREELKKKYKISNDPYTVSRRVKKLKQLESMAEKMIQTFEWSFVEKAALEQLGMAYMDLNEEITVEEMKGPLREKAQNLMQRAAKRELPEGAQGYVFTIDQYSKLMGEELSPLEKAFAKAISAEKMMLASTLLAQMPTDKVHVKQRRRMISEALYLYSLGASYESHEVYKQFLNEESKGAAPQLAQGGFSS